MPMDPSAIGLLVVVSISLPVISVSWPYFAGRPSERGARLVIARHEGFDAFLLCFPCFFRAGLQTECFQVATVPTRVGATGLLLVPSSAVGSCCSLVAAAVHVPARAVAVIAVPSPVCE